jgi:AraC-like DNA-binding protein
MLTGDNPLLESEGFMVQHYPAYANHTPSPHHLDVILFSWFISGAGTHFIDENQFAVQPGSLGITPAGISHDIITEGKMDIINLLINPRIFSLPHLPEPYLEHLHVLLPLHKSFAGLRENAVQINSTRPDIITGILMRLLSEQRDRGFGSQFLCYELIKLLIMEFIRDIAHKGHRFISKIDNRQGDKIMKVVTFLDSQFSKDHSLENLSVNFGFSRSSLCSHFKQATGKTVFEYITMKRVEQCCLLLRSTTLNISCIAYDSGFNDISFFNRKFKEITGQTPGGFRG